MTNRIDRIIVIIYFLFFFRSFRIINIMTIITPKSVHWNIVVATSMFSIQTHPLDKIADSRNKKWQNLHNFKKVKTSIGWADWHQNLIMLPGSFRVAIIKPDLWGKGRDLKMFPHKILIKIHPRPLNQTDKLASNHLMWKEETGACQAISISSNTCAKVL